MSVNFSPEGLLATQAFQIENVSNEKIAIQISLAERKMDLDGKEELPDANKLFNVFPNQMILDAKSTRTIRVTWIGDKKPTKELAYRLIAEQLPVEGFKTKTSGQAVINILLKYIASIYIVPPETFSTISLKSLKKVEKDKKNMLEVEITNSGNRHKILSEPKIILSSANKTGTTLELGGEQLNLINGQNVLAESTRRFYIPFPPQWKSAELNGELKVK